MFVAGFDGVLCEFDGIWRDMCGDDVEWLGQWCGGGGDGGQSNLEPVDARDNAREDVSCHEDESTMEVSGSMGFCVGYSYGKGTDCARRGGNADEKGEELVIFECSHEIMVEGNGVDIGGVDVSVEVNEVVGVGIGEKIPSVKCAHIASHDLWTHAGGGL